MYAKNKEESSFWPALKVTCGNVGIRLKPDDIPEDEENFEEALRAVNTALVETTISSDIAELLR